MKKRLNQYRGLLSPEKIAEGMNAARENASRLVHDAKLLAQSERYPSATALAILAIEEAGKDAILRELSYAESLTEAEKAWRRYRSHTSKNEFWGSLDLACQGARTLDELARTFDGTSDHPYILDQLKQVALYTDCLGKSHWSRPEDVINRDLALSILRVAETFTNRKPISTEEIYLWIELMGPVLRGPASSASIKTAFQAWYRAAVSLGFLDPDDLIMKSLVFGDHASPQTTTDGNTRYDV